MTIASLCFLMFLSANLGFAPPNNKGHMLIASFRILMLHFPLPKTKGAMGYVSLRC